MKKMILLGLSVFGMTNFASAWIWTGPTRNSIENGKSRFTCPNQAPLDVCATGAGPTPYTGQTAKVYMGGQYLCEAIVVMSAVPPNATEDEQIGEPIELEATSEFTIDQLPD